MLDAELSVEAYSLGDAPVTLKPAPVQEHTKHAELSVDAAVRAASALRPGLAVDAAIAAASAARSAAECPVLGKRQGFSGPHTPQSR